MLLPKFLQHQLQCQLCARLKGGVQQILWLKNETIKGTFGNRQLCVWSVKIPSFCSWFCFRKNLEIVLWTFWYQTEAAIKICFVDILVLKQKQLSKLQTPLPATSISDDHEARSQEVSSLCHCDAHASSRQGRGSGCGDGHGVAW